MIDTATKRQNISATPDKSTWLSANAGSGKTRVLTNRVARLLLHGVSPQNILCLTYTKAAASEMQNRLFKTLGSWAMLADGDLRKALTELGETPPPDLSKARTLFASAIEAPGGLKIQTIHSLCASILRQFPLEAGVNPQFREMDEKQQEVLIAEVLDSLALTSSVEIEPAATIYPDESLTALALDVSGKAENFGSKRSKADIFAAFGLSEGMSVDQIIDDTFQAGDIAFLKSLVPLLRSFGKPTDQKLADLLDGLSDPPNVTTLEVLEGAFLTGEGAKIPFSAKLVPTKDLRENTVFQPLLPQLGTIIENVQRARPQRIALAAAEQTLAIHRFAHAFLQFKQVCLGFFIAF